MGRKEDEDRGGGVKLVDITSKKDNNLPSEKKEGEGKFKRRAQAGRAYKSM